MIDSPTRGIFLTPTSVRNNADPRDHQIYHSAIHVYVSGKGLPDGPSDGYIERFVIYGAGDTPSPLMVSTARLLLMLWGQAWTHLHRDHPVDTPVVQVWLDPLKGAGLSPDVAGEQFKNQIYLYSVGTERLYLNWMYQDVKAGSLKSADLPFAEIAELADYVTRQVVPVRAIAADGIAREAMRRKDAAGMDAYTGLALWIDELLGSKMLLAAMSYTSPRTSDRLAEGEDFLDGFIQSVKNAERLTVAIHPLPAIPEKASFVIYLDAGTYRLGATQSFTSYQASLRSTVIRGDSTKSQVLIPSAGWYQFQVRFAAPIAQSTTFSITRSQ